MLEGRSLIEHYVSRPADDVSQIHGNIYLGRVQNVLPGMEAAFVDIGTPKNAVLYRGDVQYDAEDVEEKGTTAGSSRSSRPRQIDRLPGHEEPDRRQGCTASPRRSSLPGRFVVLMPNSTTYGISKRLPDDERKRLRAILDGVRAEGARPHRAHRGRGRHRPRRSSATSPGSLEQWEQIDALAAKRPGAGAALPRARHGRAGHPRGVQQGVPRGRDRRPAALRRGARLRRGRSRPSSPTGSSTTTRADEPLPMFEQFHVHEQLHKALDRKVWLPSGGSLIIEHTEALTVIDVNTGKNVGTSSLEETVFRNNLEAAEEVARQLRLRDIGGIIVIDFIDMEIRANRDEVGRGRSATPSPGTRPAPRCSTSPSSAWSR